MENKGEKPDTGKKGLKNSKAFWIAVYVVIGAMLLGGVYMLVRQYVLIPTPYTPPPTPAPTIAATPAPTLAPEETPAPAPSPTPYVKHAPVKIYFPDRKLEADIYPVGLTEEGAMGTLDSALDAAWYEGGPSPGEPGNAILNGHVHFKGVKGTFSILKSIHVGEPVVIRLDDGSYKYFTVALLETYPFDACPPMVMYLGGDSRMTLITCLGDYDRKLGTSRSRVVAVCLEDHSSVGAAASGSSISGIADQ